MIIELLLQKKILFKIKITRFMFIRILDLLKTSIIPCSINSGTKSNFFEFNFNYLNKTKIFNYFNNKYRCIVNLCYLS